MITKDKISEIFCILDEFSKNFDAEMQNHSLLTGSPKPRRRRKASLSDREIMTILSVFHFGTFANFKHYYLHFIKVHLHSDFLSAVSYNRFVELESRVFFKLTINNFIMNPVSAIGAYCFYDNKPEVIYGYTIQQQTKQIVLF